MAMSKVLVLLACFQLIQAQGGAISLQQVFSSLEQFKNTTFSVAQQLLDVQKEVRASVAGLKDSLIALNTSFQEQLRNLSNHLQGGNTQQGVSHELQEMQITLFRLHIDVLQLKLQSTTAMENLQQQMQDFSRANLSSLNNSFNDLKTSIRDQHLTQQKDIKGIWALQSEVKSGQVQLLQQFQNTSADLLHSLQQLQTEDQPPVHVSPTECAAPNLTVSVIRETVCDVLDTHLQQKEENESSANWKLFKDMMKNVAYKISNFSEKIEELLEENSERIEKYVANITVTHQSTTDSNVSGVSSQLFCHHFIPQSCSEIAWCFPNSPPGFYEIVNSSSEKVTVYCTPKAQCCNSAGGWMRVAYLNMTDPIQECPHGFRLRTDHSKRTCGRASSSRGCTSIVYSSHGLAYRKVCGKVIAYQYSAPDAFGGGTRQIDNTYVDGVSITHGRNPRQHVWTFAAALDETQASAYACPCTRMDSVYTGLVPGYVSNDYFCDTGSHGGVEVGRVYHEDPLWDGEGCGPNSSCCTFNSPPWFCKHLPQPTTDDIEIRVCSNSAASYEDTPLEMIEVYIQ